MTHFSKVFSFLCGLVMIISCLSCIRTTRTKEMPTDTTINTVEDCNTTNPDSVNESLGHPVRSIYVGNLPSASGSGIVYTLTVCSREHSGDGTFNLSLKYKETNNRDGDTFEYSGKRFTQRGIPGEDNATVWQCVNDSDNERFNFLVVNDSTLLLLNSDFERPQSGLDYHLHRQSRR